MFISSLCLLSDMSRESKLPVTDRCRSHCPDGMVNSCSSITSNDTVTGIVEGGDMLSSPLMTRSLDPTLLYTSSSVNHDTNNSDQSESSSTQLVLEDCGAGRKYEYIMLAYYYYYYYYYYYCDKYSISDFGINRFKILILVIWYTEHIVHCRGSNLCAYCQLYLPSTYFLYRKS
jgi:hypothetical protein